MGQFQFVVNAKENSVSGGVPLQTGINLSAGNVLSINVSPDDLWSSRPDGSRGTSNANGLGNPFGDNIGTFTKSGYTFLFGSLIGSLDGGQTFFPVGTKLEMTMLGPGRLSLFYWDSDNQNNGDAVTATIAVYKGPVVWAMNLGRLPR
jgi:hypothetical protein